jgi:cytochrome o ubiquinol oxidase subunit 1
MAVPPADFLVHNSLFLIAHFHNVIIGGVVFGMFAGIIFYWPKMFGWKLNEAWGKAAFWFWFFGFYFAFMPLYILGFMGMTRRLNTYDNPEWDPYLAIALFGAVLLRLVLHVSYANYCWFLTTSSKHGLHRRSMGWSYLNGRLHLLLHSITLHMYQKLMVLTVSGLTKKMV